MLSRPGKVADSCTLAQAVSTPQERISYGAAHDVHDKARDPRDPMDPFSPISNRPMGAHTEICLRTSGLSSQDSLELSGLALDIGNMLAQHVDIAAHLSSFSDQGRAAQKL